MYQCFLKKTEKKGFEIQLLFRSTTSQISWKQLWSGKRGHLQCTEHIKPGAHCHWPTSTFSYFLFLANSSFFWQMLHLCIGTREGRLGCCSFEGLQIWSLSKPTLLKEPWITAVSWNRQIHISIYICHYILQIFDSVRSITRSFGKNTWQDKHKT